MALVQTASPIVDVRGTIGGTVFTRDASGLHAQKPARVVRRRSPLQDRRRRAFAAAAAAWHQAQEAGTGFLWELYAARHPFIGRLGQNKTPTGYQMFMRFNIYRAYNNVPLILLPPKG